MPRGGDGPADDRSTRVEIRGTRLLLRPLRPAEIDDEWRAMVEAGPMTIAFIPEEAGFRARLGRSGRLEDGRLDLAVDLGGESIGRIQTFVPPVRSCRQACSRSGSGSGSTPAARATAGRPSRC